MIPNRAVSTVENTKLLTLKFRDYKSLPRGLKTLSSRRRRRCCGLRVPLLLACLGRVHAQAHLFLGIGKPEPSIKECPITQATPIWYTTKHVLSSCNS